MVQPVDIVNEALNLIGNNAPAVTGAPPNFDTSANGKAAANLYAPCVATVARMNGWDFARRSVALTPSGNTAPFPMGFSFEYLYPPGGVEIWQVQNPALTDANNPLPVNYEVGNTDIAAVPTKVIWCDFDNAIGLYNNNPGPDLWDPGFRQAVVRLLASALDLATAGKPEAAQLMLENYGKFEAAAEMRDA